MIVLRSLRLTRARRIFAKAFFGGTSGRQGGSVTSSVCVLAAAGDVLTQLQQHQTEASAAAANAEATTRVCLQELKLSPSPNLFIGHNPLDVNDELEL